jgi:tetratricopeptide (TPR) repeat protein
MAFSQISRVSDHLAYISLIGLTGLAAAAAQALWDRFRERRRLLSVLGVVVLSWLGLSTLAYSVLFAREIGLWTYTLQKNPAAWPAHVRLGLLRLGRMEYEEAEVHQRTAVRLLEEHPGAEGMRKTRAVALANLSVVLEARRDLDGAVAALREASRLQPQSAEYPVRLGRILLGTGRRAEALEQFREALRREPDFSPAQEGIAAVQAVETGGSAPP